MVISKWMFKNKEDIQRIVEPNYNLWLIPKDFTQVEEINYSKIFPPVIKHCSIKVSVSILNHYNLEL